MKRSKIILGATTCILAIFALAATRAHKFSQTKICFYSTNVNNATCLRAGVGLWFTKGSVLAYTKVRLTGRALLYTASNLFANCSGNPCYSNNGGE